MININFPTFEKLSQEIQNTSKGLIQTTPLRGSSKTLFIDYLSKKEKQLVVLLPTIRLVQELEVELHLLECNQLVISITDFTATKIQEKLSGVAQSANFIIISTYNLVFAKLPKRETISDNLFRITLGDTTGYQELLDILDELEYRRDKFVLYQGDYAQRGAIIDFWSFSEEMPVRIEFDGDFIESMRTFDAESQRSIEKRNSLTLASRIDEKSNIIDTEIFNYLEKPIFFINKSDFEIFLKSPEKIVKAQNKVESKKEKIIYDFEENFPDVKEPNEESIVDFISIKRTSDFVDFINSKPGKWVTEVEIGTEKIFETGFFEAPPVKANYTRLLQVLTEYSEKHYSIFLAAENEIQAQRLKDLLADINEDIALLIENGKVRIIDFPIKEGFIYPVTKQAVFSDYQLFIKPYRTKVPKKIARKKSTKNDFASIRMGDYVVHEDFGVAKYEGLINLKIGDISQESMKLTYGEGATVYVNLNYLHLVKKYSAGDTEAKPVLAVLGSNSWQNLKKKTKKKIREIAKDLIELYAKRKSAQGFAFTPDSVWQRELEASFIYEDTPDQEKVTREVKTDMESITPMDRLVCGDVGFGKTEIAVRAAFKCVQDNKQAAVLVPTTILADQHFNNFNDRLSQFVVKVEVLSRFQTKAEQKIIVENLKAGKVDIIIGTHRILSKDIEFKDLGLLVIDEEHRFGVNAKEKLRKFKANVDTLTLTATPIPRTLNFSLLGARDLSIIATPPPNRIPIYTKVMEFDILKIREWISAELDRGGQVYVVHDRIHSIYKFSEYIKKYLPQIKIGIAHGQMKPEALETVIHDFQNRKFDILISTKIIESGIDIPNVNTIIINRADRFGLAELHQLRGRVGRSDRQAYAYFLVPTVDILRKHTAQKLRAIEEYSDLGEGFNLAMRDLEIRGAGNLLGTDQTGFVQEVGFDLFLKLIDETVDELKRTEYLHIFKDAKLPPQKSDPVMDTYFEISIPKVYMPDQSERLSFYSSLLALTTLQDLKEIKEELLDRFGSLPQAVERLLKVAELKYYSSRALFEKVKLIHKSTIITLPHASKEEFYKIKFNFFMSFVLTNYRDRAKFNQNQDVMTLTISHSFESPEQVLDFLLLFSRDSAALINP